MIFECGSPIHSVASCNENDSVVVPSANRIALTVNRELLQLDDIKFALKAPWFKL